MRCFDFEIFHDGTLNRFQSVGAKSFQFNPKNTDVGLKIIYDGAVELYHDNNKKLETSSSGVTVTGTVTDSKGDLRKIPFKQESNAYQGQIPV